MTEKKKNVFDIVNERIIAELEKGVVPWHKPWTEAGIPANLMSGRRYRNINYLLLSMMGYERNLFLTWNQIQEIGANVKKGEHANMVVFSKKPEAKTNEEGKEEMTKGVLRYYMVFNVSQCENIPTKYLKPLPERENEPLQCCSEIVEWMPSRPEIIHGTQDAFYHFGDDYINMPGIATFEDSESYYSVLFHELIHSTGHQNRLDRKSLTSQDSESKSIEELIAEIGACYLMSAAGLPEAKLPDSAAYIEFWLNTLKNDRKFIFIAASHAQKAVDYILGKPEDSEGNEAESALAGNGLDEVDLTDLPF